MDASIVDLRYHMNDVLKAIKRRETVNVYERNKLVGYFVPVDAASNMRIQDHPFFGSASDDERPVREMVRELRKPRTFDAPRPPARKPRKKTS
jgi:antitoxin (DNA-binding transcriptional repressor) of toxin-antitoxin stability system